MMARLRESKWFYMLLSVLLAVVFWMYVRAEVDPDDSATIHNVRVEVTGSSVLTSQGLTVAELSEETVDLTVEAPASVISNLLRYREDVYVTLDVSRCVEGENRVSYSTPFWPTNFNTEDAVVQDRQPSSIIVTVEKLYTKTFNVEFRFDGQVAEDYQMGTPAIEPSTVVVSGAAEEVNQVAGVAAILEEETLSERFAGDLPLTLLDSQGEPLTGLEVTLSADSAYVVVPVVIHKDIPLKVNYLSGGGATQRNIVDKIDPEFITVSGEEADLANLTEIFVGSVDLSKVVGTNTFQFPISLDPKLENVSGETAATVTVTVQGLDTQVFQVENISLTGADGKNAVVVTQEKAVTVRGRAEDLAEIDASQLRIVADLSGISTTGQISVPARVYLDASDTVGVIGEYTIVVNIGR